MYMASFFAQVASNEFNIIDFGESKLQTYADLLDELEGDEYAVAKCYDLQPCGTIGCHAGWATKLLAKVPANNFHGIPNNHYSLGIKVISRIMGFDSRHLREGITFSVWAQYNPNLWGNEFGGLMFTGNGGMAFGKDCFIKVTLKDIAEWYGALAGRLNPTDNGYVAPPKYNGGEA